MVLDGDANVLFIQRAVKRGDPWSGHVALPGGHADAAESFEQAARRETLEEVGLDLRGAELLGGLDDRTTPAHLPTKLVRPFVFAVPRFGELRLQAEEVADTRIVPLGRLLDGHGRGRFELPWNQHTFTLPCVDLDGARLWGLTLRIVDDLLHRLDDGGVGLERGTPA